MLNGFTLRLRPALMALLVASIGVFSQTAVGEDGSWTQWRGPNRDGKATNANIRTDWKSNPPKLAWKADGFGSGYASLSVAGDHIYTTGNMKDGQYVFAASKSDGEIVWKKRLTQKPPKHGYQGSRCTPTVDGDMLYVVSSEGSIHALERATGDEAWRRDFQVDFGGKMMSGWGFSESPLVDGDWVLCTPGGPKAMIVALQKSNGETVWESSVPAIEQGKQGAGYSSIVISNGAGVKQYVQLIGNRVIGVRADDGKFLWGYAPVANKVANICTPIISGDYVFASSGYGTGSALLKLSKSGDGVDAKEVYFLDANQMQVHHGGIILKDGYLYAGHGHNNGFPICVKLETGEIVWGGKLRGPGRKSAVVTYADGHLIFRYQTGEIGLIEATPEEYRLKGVFTPEVVQEPSWSAVVPVDGKLYLRENGVLMCYDASAG